jgi:hypothetical protein
MWIFPVIKICLGALFATLGFVAIIGGFLPHFQKWIQEKRVKMLNSYPVRKRAVLVVVGFLFAAFFTSEVVTGIMELKEKNTQSKAQNPIYQHRIALIYDARVLAKHLPEIGPEDRDNFFESHEFFWLQRLCNDLQSQGLKADKIKEIYQKDGIKQKTLNHMSDELNRLANELSKINEDIENKGEYKP